MATIHPFAVVSPHAELGLDVVVGPFCVIEPGVIIEAGCTLASHVTVKSGTTLGPDNQLHEGVVLGGLPQHVQPPGPPGRLVLGAGNVFREGVTIHRSLFANGTTVVGQENYLMVGCHIGHDCQVGNNVIVANNSQIAGHITVGNRAFISGLVAIHQYSRIGAGAMIGGCARVPQDVLPWVTLDGDTNKVVGLNLVGLRRAGIPREQISQLKEAYQLVFRSGLAAQELIELLQQRFLTGPAGEWAEFLKHSKRGWIHARKDPTAIAIKATPTGEASSDDEQGSRESWSRAG